MILNGVLFVSELAIFLACLVIYGYLLFLANKKYQDQSFLGGVFISGLLNSLFLLSTVSFYFFLAYILGLAFGIAAGYFNTVVKRGPIGGAAGITLSWLIFGILSTSSFPAFFVEFFTIVYVIPSILCGALGGFIGSKIRERSDAQITPKSVKK